ncbi:MAG TPA: class I SAM-dependent methyltransferase [Ktedonobacteraceae bacterium]
MQDFNQATEITITTYQQIASFYAGAHKFPQLSDFWRERLQRFSAAVQASPAYHANPSLPLLDIGCGPGRDPLFLAEMGFEVLATDLSEAMLEEARKRCEGQAGVDHITFRKMDMRALDLPDASCAALWVSASFLHIPKRENLAVLQELIRVLVPGGPLMILVKECDSGEAERYELHQQTGKPRFFARYRGPELWSLLEQAGLTVLEITTTIDTRFADRPRWLGALATN